MGVKNFDNSSGRFHLVPVRLDPTFGDYYLPARLSSKAYPNLLAAGAQIDTIAAPTLLAVANLKPGSERYERRGRMSTSTRCPSSSFMRCCTPRLVNCPPSMRVK